MNNTILYYLNCITYYITSCWVLNDLIPSNIYKIEIYRIRICWTEIITYEVMPNNVLEK